MFVFICLYAAAGPEELDGGGGEAGKIHSRAHAANLLCVNVSLPCVSPLWGLTLQNMMHRLAHNATAVCSFVLCSVSGQQLRRPHRGLCYIYRERERHFFCDVM